jgi:hypothetical protein
MTVQSRRSNMTEAQLLVRKLYDSGQLISSHQVLLDYPEPDDPWGDKTTWADEIRAETVRIKSGECVY